MSTGKTHDEFETRHTERMDSDSRDEHRPYVTELIHLHDIEPRGPGMLRWEKTRHSHARWFVECLAEATGTFIYSFAGGAAGAAYILGTLAGAPIGSLFSIGAAYAVGIILALTICSATSGGHINPCITITMMIFHKFPVARGLRFIVAQIFGAYVAFGCLYVQYRPLLLEVEAGLMAKGLYESTVFTATGPAGVFALYAPAGAPLGNVFFNEFIVDFVLALTIFACLDPTNLLVPPATAPWVIALAYGMAVWGFVPNGLAANAARDLGGRLMAVTLYGTRAWGGSYAAIAALTNIPATLLAAVFYSVLLQDTQRVVNPAQKLFRDAHLSHTDRMERIHKGEDVLGLNNRETSKA